MSLRPELLCPAGDRECAQAAVENGADAIYFGVRSGLNARARAVNFLPEELPELMGYLHLRGVRGYLTLNTLVFTSEMGLFAETVRAAVSAGVDAVLLQDLGALRVVRELAPEWPLHASTQMSLSSAEGIRVAQSLGIRRVVLARELSLDEIRQIRAETDMELEVFVHGALCMSYSGQCTASLGLLGNRSGNRGDCSQPCRLPYDFLRDGEQLDLDGRRFVLSPQDLAAYDVLPELIAAGVSSLKIEGRLKSAEYVAATTGQYRRAIDAALAGTRVQLSADDLYQLDGSFSRGFSHGWLDGFADRQLVPGHHSANRGVPIGRVVRVAGERVTVALRGPVQRGDGLVFPSVSEPEAAQGGRVYEVFVDRRSVKEAVAEGNVELTFRHGAIDFAKVQPGDDVLKTDDPQLDRRLRKTFATGRQRRVPLDVTVVAAVGRPLCVAARAESGAVCRLESPEPLAAALRHPLTAEVLAEQLGRLGGSVYELRHLDARIEGTPMAPLSVLGSLRRQMIEALDAAVLAGPALPVAASGDLPAAFSCGAGVPPAQDNTGDTPVPQAVYHYLCRSLEQLVEAMQQGAASVTADLSDLGRVGEAVRLAREHCTEIYLAAPRIQKPGEMPVLARLAAQQPDGLLVRNLASAAFCRAENLPFVADASFHAVNPWTVAQLLDLGARRVTTAYDLNDERLDELLAAVPAERLEVIVYQHLPLFHTEHCLYTWAMVPGANRRRCGEICRRHDVRLRDRNGVEHVLWSDPVCRNTLFHAEPDDRRARVPALLRRGVRHFRIERVVG